MASERGVDLLQQGFMKQRRAPAITRPIVACEACQNWHQKGKHTKPRTR